MADLMGAYWQLPPVSRTLTTAIFATSVGVYTGLIPAGLLYFHKVFMFMMPPQVWRLFGSYLVTQPKLSILLDPYFFYNYISQLETSNPRFSRREDLVWYLVFVTTSITFLDSVLDFNSGFYLQGLILALAYTLTQDQRGIKVNFFILTIPAQFVPYALIAMSLVMNGPNAIMIQLCGLASAHMYDFLTRIWPEFGGGRNILSTPAFVGRLLGTATGGGRAQAPRGFGTSFRGGGAGSGAGGTTASASGASRTSGSVLPDSWRTRGRGQRLGGD